MPARLMPLPLSKALPLFEFRRDYTLSNDFNSNSRSGYRAKRKKTNLVLNSLIIIVLLLIIFVAYTIFSSGSHKAASKKDHPITKTVKKSTSNTKDSKDTAKNEQSSDKTSGDNQSSDKNSSGTQSNDGSNADNQSVPAQSDQSQAVVTNGGSSSNVQKTIENPAWKPLGTSQTGAHTPSYNTESVDWQEMLNAISYATGLDQSNMIVQFLGRDKTTTNASVGTVYSKDKQQKYKVYIKWVDGQGWQPTKVEELSAIQ
jgi:FtsZ-interacting cell division protein ZipA